MSTGPKFSVVRPTRENGEQVGDQHLHALGAVDGEGDVLLGLVVELVAVLPLEQLAEVGDLAQRLGQVVRGDVGELLEIGVGPREVFAALQQHGPRTLDPRELAGDARAHRVDVARRGRRSRAGRSGRCVCRWRRRRPRGSVPPSSSIGVEHLTAAARATGRTCCRGSGTAAAIVAMKQNRIAASALALDRVAYGGDVVGQRRRRDARILSKAALPARSLTSRRRASDRRARTSAMYFSAMFARQAVAACVERGEIGEQARRRRRAATRSACSCRRCGTEYWR